MQLIVCLSIILLRTNISQKEKMPFNNEAFLHQFTAGEELVLKAVGSGAGQPCMERL